MRAPAARPAGAASPARRSRTPRRATASRRRPRACGRRSARYRRRRRPAQTTPTSVIRRMRGRRPDRPSSDEQRPEQVELLLDRERPGSAGTGSASTSAREVVGRLRGEAPVGDVERGRDAPTSPRPRLLAAARHDGAPRRIVTTSTSDGGGQQPAGPAGVERPEVDPARCARARARAGPVIRKPDSTKNTSTPTKPPREPGTPAWNSTTRRTATPRSPSMSGRNAPWDGVRAAGPGVTTARWPTAMSGD